MGRRFSAGRPGTDAGAFPPDVFFLALSGGTTGLSWLFYFKALQSGPVSKVAPIDKLSVAMAMLLAFLILGETPDMKTVVGGLLIVAGSIVILF